MSLKISQMAAAGSLTGDELLEISVLSTTVTITATTLSAQASDNSFNDSANGLIAAGFAVGDQVKVVGFTGDTANNIYSAKITVLTAGKMTIGGTEGDVIVDDAAGESVTITKWTTARTTAQEIADLGGGGGSATAAVQTESGTSYNLLAADSTKYLRFTNAGAKTVTVQPDATEALPANGEWHIRNVGAGNLTIVQGSGVTVTPPSDGTLVLATGMTVTLKWVATNALDLFGQTVAA